ncbi:MAG: F0F1 ATP synthase subunit epsilon [Anaerolinea sp.]|nr:F0F1 ATP synthase subunit epsilon [Anaerolinea sp.]
MPIHVEITSQDRSIYSGDADIVVVPGTLGEMGILPNHSPLLSTLKFGVIRVRSKADEKVFTVAGGIVEVQPDQVTILADSAENVDEIDVTRAEAARKRAEELLQKTIPQDTDTYLSLQAALKRSNLRLDSVRKYRKSHI